MGLYEVRLFMLGSEMGTMIANFHMCGIMLEIRAVSTCSLVWNTSPRGPMF